MVHTPESGGPRVTGGHVQPRSHGPRINRTRSGRWRPDSPFAHVQGLKVSFRRARGITADEVLEVPFRLQVPPIGDFGREYGYERAKFTTLRRGERSRPMGRTLKTVSISTMLLDGAAMDDAGFPISWPHSPHPQKVLRELRWIMGDHPDSEPNPFRLLITQPHVWPDTHLVDGVYAITRMVATEKPGEVGTEYLDITFEEVDELELKRKRKGRASDATRHHEIHRNDDLYQIARRYYRSSSLWWLIARRNGCRGVSPGSEAELAKWAKRHKRKRLTIPPKPDHFTAGGPGAGGL